MTQRRQSNRYQFNDPVIGEFRTHDKFVVKDISFEGLKVVSNFAPIIGASYLLYLKNDQQIQEIEARILESQLTEFNTGKSDVFPAGALFSIRCRIENLKDEQRQFIIRLLEKRFSHLKPPEQEKITPSGVDGSTAYKKMESAAYPAEAFAAAV